MIVILTQDLMMASAASSVAQQTQAELKSVPSLEKAVELTSSGGVKLWLVDLKLKNISPVAVGEALKALAESARPDCIVYAPHVEVDLLRAANEQGFDAVLTRGQMDRGLGEILGRYAG